MREELEQTTSHGEIVPGSLLHFAGEGVKPHSGPYYVGFLVHLDSIEVG